MTAFAPSWIRAARMRGRSMDLAPREAQAHNGAMRIESLRMTAALLCLVAVAGCATSWPKPEFRWAKPDEKAFSEADARCLQLAMKAEPINEARVIDCEGDKSNVHCGTRSELKTTVKVPAPAEAEAIRETNLARQKVYSDCMAQSGS
jgi:hypothetical protein